MPANDDGRFRANRITLVFMSGVLAILPIGLTLAVLAWVVVLLHDSVGPASRFGELLRSVGLSVVACEVTAYLLGLVGTILLVYGLGLIVERGMGRRWLGPLDEALMRIPVFGTLYEASKQMTSVFDRKQDTLKSMSPVLCYFSDDRGVATPALLSTAQLVHLDGIPYHIVIVPTAPVPFGGALLCVRADRVEPIGCGFDEMVGLYMSMGVSAPRCLGRGRLQEGGPVSSPVESPTD